MVTNEDNYWDVYIQLPVCMNMHGTYIHTCYIQCLCEKVMSSTVTDILYEYNK